MATYEGAIYDAPQNGEHKQAVQDNIRAVSKHDRLGALGRGMGRAVAGGVHETGRLLKVALTAGLVGAGAGFGLVMMGFPDPIVGVKHFASAPHCAFAQEFHLDHAKYGQPGYWKHHDTDRDGVACE
jgi:hypothetical protein